MFYVYHKKINAYQIDRRIREKKSFSQQLNEMSQREFLDCCYGPFIDIPLSPEKIAADNQNKEKSREIDILKVQLVSIGKMKIDVDKYVKALNESVKTGNDVIRRGAIEGISKNISKIYQNLRSIYFKMGQKGIVFEDFGDLRKEKSFKVLKYDPEDINVD